MGRINGWWVMKRCSWRMAVILVLIGLMVGVIGCAGGGTTSPPTPLLSTGEGGKTMVPEELEPTNTSTNIPTGTHTPAITFTPTVTHSVTLTKIIVLGPAEAREKLLNLLLTNGNCQLPCVLGINPGETTQQEAQAKLEPLTNISLFTSFGSEVVNTIFVYPTDTISMTINLDYLIDDNIVSNIFFDGRAVRDNNDIDDPGVIEVFDSAFLGHALEHYLMSTVLAKFGPPSSVYLLTLAEMPPIERQPIGLFEIELHYPERGFIAHYTTRMEIKDEFVVGCFSNTHVDHVLFPQHDIEAYSSWFDSRDDLQYYLPLEDATMMTIDEFHQQFSQDNNICIKTPSELWPVPER